MTWKKAKVIYKVGTMISLSFGILGIGILLFWALFNKKLLTNTEFINTAAITLGILSLPGLLIQLFGVVTISDKKQFISNQKCPNCSELIEITLSEKE